MTLAQTVSKQYELAKALGWLRHFGEAAARYDFDVADLMAIASRETNMRNIRGDFRDGRYNGYGVMQVDIHTDPKFCESGQWESAGASIMRGAKILAEKRAQIVKASKLKQAQVRFRSGKRATFKPRPLEGWTLRACYIAAYNCGIASYYHHSLGNYIDTGTTGKNYSRDVMARAALFHDLLVSDHFAVTDPKDAPSEPVKPSDAPQVSNAGPSHDDSLTGDDALKLAKQESVKRVAGKALVRAGGAATTAWSLGTSAKVALVILGLALASVAAYYIYKHRARVKAFAVKLVRGA